jgi:hypothetical protein
MIFDTRRVLLSIGSCLRRIPVLQKREKVQRHRAKRSSPQGVAFLQFTRKIPRHTIGRPIIRDKVNSSPRKIVPKRTPKMGPKKVKEESLLTEYVWIKLNQTKKLTKATMMD